MSASFCGQKGIDDAEEEEMDFVVKLWIWEVKGNERRAKEDLRDASKVEVRIRKDAMVEDL
jgi:hypothetical protein